MVVAIDSDEMAELKRQARRIIREWPRTNPALPYTPGLESRYKEPPAAHRVAGRWPRSMPRSMPSACGRSCSGAAPYVTIIVERPSGWWVTLPGRSGTVYRRPLRVPDCREDVDRGGGEVIKV